MIIKIKQRHINRAMEKYDGVYNICPICPIAQVLIEMGYKNVYVTPFVIRVGEQLFYHDHEKVKNIKPILYCGNRNWQSFVDKEIEIPDLPQIIKK